MANEGTTQQQGIITWDNAHGHVCSCSRTEHYDCHGFYMTSSYENTVGFAQDQAWDDKAPSRNDDRLHKFVCRACGATVWSDR